MRFLLTGIAGVGGDGKKVKRQKRGKCERVGVKKLVWCPQIYQIYLRFGQPVRKRN